MTSRNVFWPDAESRRALRLAAERTGEKATYPPRPHKFDWRRFALTLAVNGPLLIVAGIAWVALLIVAIKTLHGVPHP